MSNTTTTLLKKFTEKDSRCPECQGITPSHGYSAEFKESLVIQYYKCSSCEKSWDVTKTIMD